MHVLRARLFFSPANNFAFELAAAVGIAVPGSVISVTGKTHSCA